MIFPPRSWIKPSDTGTSSEVTDGSNWVSSFEQWLDRELGDGRVNIVDEAQASFERSLIEIALKHTKGHKQEAAKRIGWGRNTITRKMQELNMN